MKYFYDTKIFDFTNFNFKLSGFSKRNGKLDFGENKLKVSILWLKQNSTDIIFISLDVLYIPLEVAEPIYHILKEKYSIEKEQVIFNATHTHSAPGIEKKFDTIVDKDLIKYFIDCLKSIFEVKNILFENGIFHYKTINTGKKIWISRRKKGKNIRSFFMKESMLLLPNQSNPVDDEIRLLLIYDENKKLKFLMYNFSCHPVFNTSDNMSSDFIGEINNILNKELKIDSMFLQGFLGDIRPNVTTKSFFETNFINKLKLIFNNEVFREPNKNDFTIFCTSVSDLICNNLQTSDNYNESIFLCKQKLYQLESHSKRTQKQFIVKFILNGSNLFLSIPAEVNTNYKLQLSKKFNNLNIIPLGVADDIIGYLPYYTEVKEGGYEVHSATNYGWDAYISEKSLKNFFLDLQNDIDLILEEAKL